MNHERPSYERCFKSAFGLIIADIEGANDVSVACLFDAMNGNTGNPRKQAKALIECLGTSGWKWSAYEGQLEKESDFKKMAESMASSVEVLAHLLYRKEQLFEVAERRPYWQFLAGAHDRTPQQCLENDGLIKHYQDPFWQERLPPCELPYCRCQVFSLSERDLARRAKKA